MFSKTLTFLALALSAYIAIAKAADCSKIFKEDDKHANVSQSCITTLKLDPKQMPDNETEFVKTYDDKCFGKCFMGEMKFIVDSKFDKDAISKDVTEHVLDEKVREKVLAYTLKCLEEAESKLKEEKITDGKISKELECKLPAQFLYCTMKKEAELQPELKCE